jgi:HemY protein
MKTLLWLILLALAATVTAMGALNNGGYVLFVLPPWRVEIALNFLPILLVVVFLGFYALLRAYDLIRQLPAQARAYQENRQLMQSHQTLFLANRLLFEGRAGQALKKASEAYLSGAPKGLASLIAARAAQRMRNRELVEPWVERAIQDDPESQASALMLLAETQIEQHRFDEAIQTLEKLQKSAGRHYRAPCARYST